MNLIKRCIHFIQSFSWKFHLYIPVFGLGCGVLGLVFKKQEVDMGKIASVLLQGLEYRGYDSTGAVIQDDQKNITLKKDVGKPSALVKVLGIEEMSGKLFCGQVRWATFGVVDKLNAQPHVVSCKQHIYGAHNGNITNTAYLKEFLVQEGHTVLSDNDGEMLVHVIEHYFDQNLEQFSKKSKITTKKRIEALRKAILKTSTMVEGSYAAVIIDPETEVMWGIKSGSSLYAGVGQYHGNPFTLVSSDLTALLKYTKNLIPFYENEFVECSYDSYQVYALKNKTIQTKDKKEATYKAGEAIPAPLQRSKLRVQDTSLKPPFKYYMEQEIYASVMSSRKLIDFFNGGSPINQSIIQLIQNKGVMEEYQQAVINLVNSSYQEQFVLFERLHQGPQMTSIRNAILKNFPDIIGELSKEEKQEREYSSKYASLLLDIASEIKAFPSDDLLLTAKILDSSSFYREYQKFNRFVQTFINIIFHAWENHHNIYTISCGTSYHASKTAALFFNEIPHIEIIPILPGNFRGQYSHTLRDGDVLIGISQSGETKDLIDIFNDVIGSDKDIRRIVVVNNENSTLAQEKSEFYLPIKCGPEIAVPATKSYMNQVVLFYYLALLAAEKRIEKKDLPAEKMAMIKNRREMMGKIPDLLEETLNTVQKDVNEVAEELYLEPSIHILATKISSVAEEGALKIRETVLNHTQGIEGSEFKHGPNTILGKNTILGLPQAEEFIKNHGEMIQYILKQAQEENLSSEETRRLIEDISEFVFQRVEPFNLSSKGTAIFNNVIHQFPLMDILDKNYPLIFVTGPEDRDVQLTISQINTHKIRGANVFVIAEPNEKLYRNASTTPGGNSDYRWNYIELPRTDDTLMTTFSSMITLQLLAFKMSVKKMKHLNRLRVPLHGVHPDVPKNVSKSITVD